MNMNNIVEIINDLFSWQFLGRVFSNRFNTWLTEVENIEYKTIKDYQLDSYSYSYEEKYE